MNAILTFLLVVTVNNALAMDGWGDSPPQSPLLSPEEKVARNSAFISKFCREKVGRLAGVSARNVGATSPQTEPAQIYTGRRSLDPGLKIAVTAQAANYICTCIQEMFYGRPDNSNSLQRWNYRGNCTNPKGQPIAEPRPVPSGRWE